MAGAQKRFLHLCRLLGEPTPVQGAPFGERLDMAHRHLDVAVAAAYGWPADLGDEEVLARPFALDQERAAAGH